MNNLLASSISILFFYPINRMNESKTVQSLWRFDSSISLRIYCFINHRDIKKKNLIKI